MTSRPSENCYCPPRAEDPAVLWDRYIQLTQIEAALNA
jgi:hypothetical protein